MATTKLTRRRLFAASAIGGAVLGGYAAFKWFGGEATEVVLAVLRRRVGHLNVDDEAFERFAADYVEWKAKQRGRLARLAVISLPLRLMTPYEWFAPGHPIRRLEDGVVSRFLLSTDFFLFGADETRAVHYLSFYDPMLAVCRNPFARSVDGG